jgi:nitrogen fixation protein NifB
MVTDTFLGDKYMKIALASGDGAFVAKHFGNTPQFLIAEVDADGWRIVEKRKNDPACDHSHPTGAFEHSHERFTKSATLIADCDAVICAQIGGFAYKGLASMGIQGMEKVGFCDDILNSYVKYLARTSGKLRYQGENEKEVHTETRRHGDYSEKVTDTHPCFDDEAHGKFGRIHLPVSAKCNIKCRFCERDINSDELRPGVSRCILKPEQAADTIARALELCPQISVIGIAGPGDALADDAALETFKSLREKFPDMSLCLSTNGLGLGGKVKEFFDAGVRHITVTVNAVDPIIGEKIVSRIEYEGIIYTGKEAAWILQERQLTGIKEAVALGMEIKINTVLIPGVNDGHIGEIAKTLSALGVKLHNTIPLIPKGEFSQTPSPTCEQLNDARKQAEQYLPVFRKCTHCRADACGVPGVNDFSKELYEESGSFRCNNTCG